MRRVTTADINVTIHAEGEGHVSADAVVAALSSLLDSSGLMVGAGPHTRGTRFKAVVTEVPMRHHCHSREAISGRRSK